MVNKIFFYLAAASTGIAGALHIAIVPMFFTFTPILVSIFFIISGLAQLFWMIPIMKRWSDLWYNIGIMGTVVLIFLFIVAVPAKGLPISALEIVIEFLQVLFIIMCGIILNDRAKSKMSENNI